MRLKATQAVLSHASKAILVLPVFDRVTSEYAKLFEFFDHVIRIGKHSRMTIRVSLFRLSSQYQNGI